MINPTKDCNKVRFGNSETPAALKDARKVKLGHGGVAPAALKDSNKVKLGHGGMKPAALKDAKKVKLGNSETPALLQTKR